MRTLMKNIYRGIYALMCVWFARQIYEKYTEMVYRYIVMDADPGDALIYLRSRDGKREIPVYGVYDKLSTAETKLKLLRCAIRRGGLVQCFDSAWTLDRLRTAVVTKHMRIRVYALTDAIREMSHA